MRDYLEEASGLLVEASDLPDTQSLDKLRAAVRCLVTHLSEVDKQNKRVPYRQVVKAVLVELEKHDVYNEGEHKKRVMLAGEIGRLVWDLTHTKQKR